MNNYNKLLNNLETLKLDKIRGNLDNYIVLLGNLSATAEVFRIILLSVCLSTVS